MPTPIGGACPHSSRPRGPPWDPRRRPRPPPPAPCTAHNKHGTGSRCTLPKRCRPLAPSSHWGEDVGGGGGVTDRATRGACSAGSGIVRCTTSLGLTEITTRPSHHLSLYLRPGACGRALSPAARPRRIHRPVLALSIASGLRDLGPPRRIPQGPQGHGHHTALQRRGFALHLQRRSDGKVALWGPRARTLVCKSCAAGAFLAMSRSSAPSPAAGSTVGRALLSLSATPTRSSAICQAKAQADCTLSRLAF